MAVYVDNARNPYGRMLMCHMVADTPEELHRLADQIGIQRRWFQASASTPHYDICQTKRRLAVERGAVEVQRREMVAIIRRLRKTAQHGTRCDGQVPRLAGRAEDRL